MRDDVWISPHAVDQRSDWPTAEAVERHIKFVIIIIINSVS